MICVFVPSIQESLALEAKKPAELQNSGFVRGKVPANNVEEVLLALLVPVFLRSDKVWAKATRKIVEALVCRVLKLLRQKK